MERSEEKRGSRLEALNFASFVQIASPPGRNINSFEVCIGQAAAIGQLDRGMGSDRAGGQTDGQK